MHRRKKENIRRKNKYYKMKVWNAMILTMTALMMLVEEVSAAVASQVESVSRLLLELS